MATAIAKPVEPISTPEEQSFLLPGIDWETYRKLSEALTGRHVRLTYDRGNLELMTISSRHGRFSGLFARLINVLTEELGLPICTCRDMTCDRQDLDRALEPDEGFYIENEPAIRDKEEIDLSLDPPPDVAVEIDLRRSPKSRMSIYAAIRVPEVWRFDGESLRIHQLGADGQYSVVEHSPHFPFVTGADLVRFVQQRTQVDENTLVRLFREWVREQIRLTKQP
jgi:Uma2 family endonuclease